ncbi:MAG: hypothetical protein Q7K39_02525 [Candidatus Magasanikbacteria bacterium]|nr:hypothetical protein [Candidatus Magasanikbacteria bacterium]
MDKKTPSIFILIVVVIAVAGYVFFVRNKSGGNYSLLPDSSVSPIAANSSGPDVSGLKTFRFDNFHGSIDISDKFQFQYPANWYNDGQYFSPQKIRYYDLYSVKAPIYFDLILVDIFDQTEFKYQIDESERAKPDSIGRIDGRDFRRYDLIDYGTYGGESAGRVIIFVGPKITVDGDEYYLVFHWEEKPLAETMPGNDVKILGEIISTLRFTK